MNKSPIKILFPPTSEEYFRSDFEFQRKIGDGAFGQVWRVRHKKSSKLFAIKQVAKTKVIRMLDQFRRELTIMYSLDHPHIVKLYSHFEDEKFFYLLMELVEGGSLFHKMSRENILLERVAAQYFREIILAIEYLHTRSPAIIHRDIKPENILICKTGRVKLTDFGWANYVNSAHQRKTSCGTLEYLPPEMVDEQGYDTCADIWCLGVLLYEMLAGTTPFKAGGKEKTMKNIKSGLLKFPLGFSHIAKELITSMLEKDQNTRFNIFQAKKHRWLTIMQPIRETIVQNYAPKIAPFKEPEKPEEVTATSYSDNDTDEENKAVSQNAFRKSIQKLQNTVGNKLKETISNRTSLKENCKEYFNLCQLEKDLEARISEKGKEVVRVVGNNRELLSKCFDANLELERVQLQDRVFLIEKSKELQKELGEKLKEIKLQKIYLEDLKMQVQSSGQGFAEKERTLKGLQKQVQEIKNTMVYSKEKQNSGIYELKVNLDVIKSQIQEKNQIITNFNASDKNLAKEISDFIRFNMSTCKDFNRELNRKLEETEEMMNEKEQQITELSIEYEMKKSQKMHNLRKKKDEYSRNIRRKREDFRVLCVKTSDELRVDLKFKLNEARRNEYYVESTQISQCTKKIETLKNMVRRLDKIAVRKETLHKESLLKVSLNTSELRKLEFELAELKADFLLEDYLDTRTLN